MLEWLGLPLARRGSHRLSPSNPQNLESDETNGQGLPAMKKLPCSAHSPHLD